LAPENTFPSFRKALEVGVRVVEFDVRLTRDGMPVLFHDERLDRVTPERGTISEWEWEALRSVRVHPGGFGGAYEAATIPSLEEVLTGLPSDTRFLVELKGEVERADALVRQVLELLVATGALERSRIISFDHDLLRRAKQQLAALPAAVQSPPLPLGVLVEKRTLDRLFPVAEELSAEAVHIPHALLDDELLTQARDRGFLVSAWTVNRPEEVRRLAERGVDEITTDFPDMALAAVSA
jgi:glycerophosphoryl diester phosphodiesterase